MGFSRAARVAELLKEEIGRILDRDLADPKIPPMVTVHSVKLSRDLRSAQVYVTWLQDEDPKVVEEVVRELNKAVGFIRTLLGRRVVLRYLPTLQFHYNPSTRYAANLEKLLREISPAKRKDEGESGGESG